MGIKPQARQAHFDADPEQTALANRLDEMFEITHGQRYGNLAIWFAEPTQKARERFGLQQEVLVVYSPHDRTDARVLTTIELVALKPEFKHRLEKVLSLVVHAGDPEVTRQLLADQADRVVVPFHRTELLNAGRGRTFVRARIAEAIGSVDLFGISSPITSDKYFFGRDPLVQVLLQRTLLAKQNSGVFGLRKTGKTSVLFALKRRLNERNVLVEYLDCQNPGVHAGRWWVVLENLANRLAATLQREFKRHSPVVTEYTERNAGTRFSSEISSLLQNGQVGQVVVMLDEVEYITPQLSGMLGGHWDEDFLPFWQTLRAAHQESQGRFCFLAAGVNPASVERSHFTNLPNPLFQLAQPHFLEPFGVQDVRHMVRSLGRYSGVRVEESVYQYLTDSFGGHPFLIRIACSEAWHAVDTKNPEAAATISVNTFTTCAIAIRTRLAQPIKDILLSLVWWYPEEYELLQILASGDATFVREYLEQHPGSSLQVARYGLLRDEGGEFAITPLREFLRDHGEDYKRELSPFTRTDMPPHLLPEIPDIDLLGRLFEQRTEIEVVLRKAVLLYLGVALNWDPNRIAEAMAKSLRARPDRPKPDALFVGRTPQQVVNELYTLDLKEIILTHWDRFQSLFESNKSRFEMNMDTLNRARRVDGHAKPFTEDELLEFNSSYAWLRARLSRLPT